MDTTRLNARKEIITAVNNHRQAFNNFLLDRKQGITIPPLSSQQINEAVSIARRHNLVPGEVIEEAGFNSHGRNGYGCKGKVCRKVNG